MSENKLYLIVIVLSLLSISMLVPAYAEVTSLKTSSPFYKGGSTISFSGTTESSDPPNVTILIFGPTNNFVMLASGVTDSNHNFMVLVDTSTSGNQHSLSVKGLYNATAFIAKKENGKTVSFVFSPDGSSLAPSPPTSLNTSVISSTEIDLSWSVPATDGGSPITGYNIERDDGSGFKPFQNTPSTSYKDTGLPPNKQYSYRVSAINSGGSSIPSNVSNATTLSPSFESSPPTQTPNPTTNPGSSQSLDDIIKQRIANANKLQQLLNGQTPNSTTNSGQSQSLDDIIKQRVENAKRLQQLTQGKQQKISLNENVKMNDLPNSLQAGISGNSNNELPINFANFDVKNILYPLVAVIGVVIVIVVLYSRKKHKLSQPEIQKEIVKPEEPASVELEDDYAVMILKNRLAKGEISVEEFKTLKNELLEF